MKGLLKCREQVKGGCCWKVWNGTHTNIWTDPWIPTLLGFRVDGGEEEGHRITLLCKTSLINILSWDIHKLSNMFSPIEVHHILGVPGAVDSLMWTPKTDGRFTPKSRSYAEGHVWRAAGQSRNEQKLEGECLAVLHVCCVWLGTKPAIML